MDIPYGFDCYAFSQNEVKYFESNILRAKSSKILPYNYTQSKLDHEKEMPTEDYIKFTRKNEYYSSEQLEALARAGRANITEFEKQTFCGIKIQIGIGVVTNFLRKGMQYRRPNKGRSQLINGTWDGIVSGLTVDQQADNSYDMAFGNFLAYDEEFPYLKFGPFFTLESKLVVLSGSPRRIATSSFGTNIQGEIWLTILILMLILSLLACFRVRWQDTKHKAFELIIKDLSKKYRGTSRDLLRSQMSTDSNVSSGKEYSKTYSPERSIFHMLHNFFFIYFTMILNKPSHEFDNLIWPKHQVKTERHAMHTHHGNSGEHNLAIDGELPQIESAQFYRILDENESLREHYDQMRRRKGGHKKLPTSIRVLSYLWSAASFVMASIYSGEMLAVMLLHADQNIDTIAQLISAKPPIEPVIRQDDFTYNLMLKSLDHNMLTLHNLTKVIPRPDVYTRRFIEGVSERKQALLGDDELIETIYDIYHKYFPLYKSKVTYLQYPISIMYRKDLNKSLEIPLRRGMVQMFEMGLIQRWYQAQKETYIKFYDTFEKKNYADTLDESSSSVYSDQKYKPLSMNHFQSFFRAMLICVAFAFIILVLEILVAKLTKNNQISQGFVN